jgi:hypothetical protein
MMAATLQYNISLLSYVISYEPHLKPYWVIDTHTIIPITSSPITDQEVEGNSLHLFPDHVWRKEPPTMAKRVESTTKRSAHSSRQDALYGANNLAHRFPPQPNDESNCKVDSTAAS